MKYKVLIVDDEEPARDLLESYSKKIGELEVVAVVSNALDAKRIIQDSEVDMLLTDIQMDDLTGIDLLKTLKNPPVTIFTTAYSEYALEGFDLDVADYLIKPISFQRFCKAIDKGIELIRYQRMSEGNNSYPGIGLSSQENISTYFFVKTNKKMIKVDYEEILFTESFGEYVKIYTQEDVIMALQTTAYMESILPSADFVRIHRSHIVNIHHISEIEGNMIVIGQQKLTISKRMKDRFMAIIKDKGII